MYKYTVLKMLTLFPWSPLITQRRSKSQIIVCCEIFNKINIVLHCFYCGPACQRCQCLVCRVPVIPEPGVSANVRLQRGLGSSWHSHNMHIQLPSTSPTNTLQEAQSPFKCSSSTYTTTKACLHKNPFVVEEGIAEGKGGILVVDWMYVYVRF